MDLPKVTPLVGGKVRTQTQAAMLDLLPDPAPPTPRRWGGGSNRCFNTLGTISSLFILSSLEHFLSPGPPAAPLAAKTLECQL